MSKTVLLTLIVAIAVAIVALLFFIRLGLSPLAPSSAPAPAENQPVAQKINQEKQNTMPQPPAMQINPAQKYRATLKTTAGVIVIELTAAATPKTVNNFVALARQNFYNNSPFHRVIKDFMIQGGDPTGTGRGGPGYTFPDEPFTGEYTRGTVAMANAGPNTNGSQFFIMHADVALPKNYVIFGHVVSGLDVVDKIATAPVESNGGEVSKPVTPVTIESITIEEI